MPLVIAALLGLSAAMIVLYPLLGLRRELEGGSAALADLAERERAAKGALREVEFDHSLGNLEDADYQALRERYETRALAALRSRYSRECELDALIDQQLEALSAEDTRSAARAGDAGHEQAGTSIPRRPAANSKTKGLPARRRRGGSRA
jgi:hypothetical protein